MKRAKSKSEAAACGRSLQPVVGQFISSECLGNFYVNAPSGEVIAMTPRRKLAQSIADAMNRSKGRTAKLLRCGWTVGRDEMLYPPNPSHHAPAPAGSVDGVVQSPNKENENGR